MRKNTKGRNAEKTKSHSRKKPVKDKITEKDMAGNLGIMSQAT